MGRTWLVRGISAAVVAVLVGAWAVGVSGLRDSPSPAPEPESPASPDTSVVSQDEQLTVRDEPRPPLARKTDRPRDKVTKPKRDRPDEPADETPTDPAPDSPSPTPDPPESTHDSPDPPSPPPPSGTPNEPSDECTDLLSTLDCVLNPITAQPRKELEGRTSSAPGGQRMTGH